MEWSSMNDRAKARLPKKLAYCNFISVSSNRKIDTSLE